MGRNCQLRGRAERRRLRARLPRAHFCHPNSLRRRRDQDVPVPCALPGRPPCPVTVSSRQTTESLNPQGCCCTAATAATWLLSVRGRGDTPGLRVAAEPWPCRGNPTREEPSPCACGRVSILPGCPPGGRGASACSSCSPPLPPERAGPGCVDLSPGDGTLGQPSPAPAGSWGSGCLRSPKILQTGHSSPVFASQAKAGDTQHVEWFGLKGP